MRLLEKYTLGYAYSPGERATGSGKYHLITEVDVADGRLRRAAGDPLCKPADKFWGVSRLPESDKARTKEAWVCKRCREVAARLSPEGDG